MRWCCTPTGRAPRPRQLAGEIDGAGGRAAVVLADLADPDALRGLVPAAAAFGPLTLLVNNASVFDEDEIGTLTRAQFDATMAVNLTAPLFLAQAFAAQADAAARDASIVNIVDQRVLRPTPKFFSYTLSKSALHMATTTLAQALAPLRVNAVAPGPMLPSPRQNDGAIRGPGRQPCRSGRGRRREDIADAVLYLAGAKSVTGVTIAVDGGQHLAWRTADSDVAE